MGKGRNLACFSILHVQIFKQFTQLAILKSIHLDIPQNIFSYPYLNMNYLDYGENNNSYVRNI